GLPAADLQEAQGEIRLRQLALVIGHGRVSAGQLLTDGQRRLVGLKSRRSLFVVVANVTDTFIAARQGTPPIIEPVMLRMSGDKALQNGERFAVQLQGVW